MKIETKKKLAKEILIFLSIITITLLYYLGLNLNNTYQKYNIKKLQNQYETKQLILDSINKPILVYNNDIEVNRINVFSQFGRLYDGYEIPIKLPKGFKLNEKIGRIENKGEHWDIDANNFAHIEFIIINYDKKNELPILYDYDRFSKMLTDSIKFRNFIYEKLKQNYDDSECNNISEFELLIGIKFPKEIKDNKIIADKINTETDILKNEITITKNRFVDAENISKFSLYFLYTLIALSFVLRYMYYLLKWCYRILTIK